MRGATCLLVACGLLVGCESSQQPSAVSVLTVGPTAPIIADSPVAVAPAPVVPTSPNSVAGMPVEKPTTRPLVVGTFTLSGNLSQKGSRDLFAGETVCDVLHSLSIDAASNKLTVVLNRRCPEGTTSEMIDVSSSLTVLDPRRNYELRDGDELIVSTTASAPADLAKPIAADVPPAR